MTFSKDPRKIVAYEARGTFRSLENALIPVVSDVNVSVAYFHILRLPWDEKGVIQKKISDLAFLTPSVTSQLIQKMEKDGLLRRAPDAFDRRIKKVFITDEGIALKETVMERALMIPEVACVGLSDEDVNTAITVMRTMRKNLEKASF